MKYSAKLLSISATIVLSASLLYGIENENLAINNTAIQRELAFKEVIFQAEPGLEVSEYINSIGGSIEQEVDFINGYIAKIPEDRLGEVKAKKGLRNVSQNHLVDTTKMKIGQDNIVGKALGQRNNHIELINADSLKYKGKGVTVAVLDSGVADINHLDVIESFAINPKATTDDLYGHGTHVAGIITGNSIHTGVAPKANIVNVKLGNDAGIVDEVDLLLGLQWVYDNKDLYNIKVVNLSVSSTMPQSYLKSPVSAAVEQLWLNGVTVVTAAGNDKTQQGDVNYPPANDPFVITVGALDGVGKNAETVELAEWSKRGTSTDNVVKPELHAPGVKILSYLSSKSAILATEYPEAVYNKKYMEMSGTSMSAPVVSGAIALMLEANPDLSPDEIKYILTETAQPTATEGAQIINVKEAIKMAKDKGYLNSLDLSDFNKWQRSEFIEDGGSTVDYTKLVWRNLDWLKLCWRSADWAKLVWRSHWDRIGQEINQQ